MTDLYGFTTSTWRKVQKLLRDEGTASLDNVGQPRLTRSEVGVLQVLSPSLDIGSEDTQTYSARLRLMDNFVWQNYGNALLIEGNNLPLDVGTNYIGTCIGSVSNLPLFATSCCVDEIASASSGSRISTSRSIGSSSSSANVIPLDGCCEEFDVPNILQADWSVSDNRCDCAEGTATLGNIAGIWSGIGSWCDTSLSLFLSCEPEWSLQIAWGNTCSEPIVLTGAAGSCSPFLLTFTALLFENTNCNCLNDSLLTIKISG